MTKLQILDLQLVNENYYWCNIEYENKPIILKYYFHNDLNDFNFFQTGSEIAIEILYIKSIDPHQLEYKG